MAEVSELYEYVSAADEIMRVYTYHMVEASGPMENWKDDMERRAQGTAFEAEKGRSFCG